VSAERLRIILDIDPTIEPIEGSMSVTGLPARDFSGWMGLTRALERALTTPTEAETNQDTPAGTPPLPAPSNDPMKGFPRYP